MSIWLTIRISFRALIRAPLRALLTLLGIVIGIGAVLAMVALGEGTRAGIEASLSSLGSNLVTVLSGAQLAGGARGQGILLNEGDAEAMMKLPSLRSVAPVLRGSAQLVAGPRNWSTSVAATTPDYLEVRSWQLESGSFFTPSEYRNAAKVCVLGKITAQNLFGEDDPIGQKIRANKMTCEVIGVLEAKGGSAMGQDQDDTLVLPLTTYKARMSAVYVRHVSMILASAISAEASSQLN